MKEYVYKSEPFEKFNFPSLVKASYNIAPELMSNGDFIEALRSFTTDGFTEQRVTAAPVCLCIPDKLVLLFDKGYSSNVLGVALVFQEKFYKIYSHCDEAQLFEAFTK